MKCDKTPWVLLGAWKAYELVQPINEVGPTRELTDTSKSDTDSLSASK